MPAPRWLPLVLAALGGAAITWVIKPDAAQPDTAQENPPPVMKRKIRSAGKEDSRIAARWMDRLATGDMRNMAKDVPASEMKAVLDSLMAEIWGNLSREQLEQMALLIGEWSKKDRNGALAWARNLRHPQQRELGISFIAFAIGEKDPQAGFEIYTELPEVTLNEGLEHLSIMMAKLYRDAAPKGADAMLELMRRLPDSKNRNSSFLNLDYPDGFDFAAMMDGMTMEGYFTKGSARKPITLTSPLRQWAGRDSEAAFSYLVEHAKAGTSYRISDVVEGMANHAGREATNEWLGAKLAGMDFTQRQELIKGGMPRYESTEGLLEIIETMPTAEAAANFRYDILQAYNDSGLHFYYGILNGVPDMEERLTTIERLHGVTDTERLKDQLRQWQVPRERIDTIVDKVTKVKRKE